MHAMEHDDFQFDEPSLKGAVQRAWGSERSPQRLRARVSRLIATAASVDQVPAPVSTWERWQERVYGLAAAAVLILGIGLLVLYYQGAFESNVARFAGPVQPIGMPSKTPMPISLAQSMVATHNACGKLHDHRLVDDLPANNYRALSVKLTSDLGFPVIARGLGPEWTFRGAGECSVGDLRGSHLLFVRGDESISVFSLPSSCMMGIRPGAQFEGPVQGQPVAGFSRGGAVYAFVGSSAGASLTTEAVTAIRDGFFSQFDPESCGDIHTDLDFDY